MSDIIIKFTEEEFERLTSVTMFSSNPADFGEQLKLVVQRGNIFKENREASASGTWADPHKGPFI